MAQKKVLIRDNPDGVRFNNSPFNWIVVSKDPGGHSPWTQVKYVLFNSQLTTPFSDRYEGMTLEELLMNMRNSDTELWVMDPSVYEELRDEFIKPIVPVDVVDSAEGEYPLI